MHCVSRPQNARLFTCYKIADPLVLISLNLLFLVGIFCTVIQLGRYRLLLANVQIYPCFVFRNVIPRGELHTRRSG